MQRRASRLPHPESFRGCRPEKAPVPFHNLKLFKALRAFARLVSRAGRPALRQARRPPLHDTEFCNFPFLEFEF